MSLIFKTGYTNWFQVPLALAVLVCACECLYGQTEATPQTNWRIERAKVERQWTEGLQDLGNWCRENGLQDELRETFAWYQVRDPERTYVFLPDEAGFGPAGDDLKGQWQTQLSALRKEHALRILELAEKAAAENDGTSAFRLLNEVLYYDPDHEAVRKILGHRRTDEGWRVASDRVKVKQATKVHPVMKWPKGTWAQVTTPHFNISSQANEETTMLLANSLERWQSVWRQVFFEFWSRPDAPARWLAGNGTAPRSRKKFDVIFFASQEEYIRQLQDEVPGIEVSTGYYEPGEEISFFYASTSSEIHDTWRHELTHQLFQESIKTRSKPFDDGHLWLGEGIAMYFESLVDFGPYVTLGGFDSRRVQFARIRKFREGFEIPLADIAGLDRNDFQRQDNLRRLYGQCAGMTHMLMDHNSGAHQRDLAAFIKMMYQGRLKEDAFQNQMSLTFPDLEIEYKEYLGVESGQVERFLSAQRLRTELALPDAQLSADALARVGECTQLTWLDLTANEVTGAKLEPLTNLHNLNSLYLTNCLVDQSTFAILTEMRNLKELDLSGSSVTDAEMASVVAIPGLTTLRLTRTGISNIGLEKVLEIETLQTIDLSGSQVTDQGKRWLKRQRPELTIN